MLAGFEEGGGVCENAAALLQVQQTESVPCTYRRNVAGFISVVCS